MTIKRKHISKTMRLQVLQKYNHHCAYCGCEISFKSMRVDHFLPLQKGGLDEVGNYMPACHQCNHYKSVFTIPINLETYTKLCWYSSPLKGNFLSSTYVTYTSKAGFGTVDDKIHFISTAPELREKYAHSYCSIIMISYFLTITLIYIVESIDKARLAEDSELVKIYKEENK